MKKLLLIAVSAIMLIACGGEKKSDLINTSWLLVELNGEAVHRADLDNQEAYSLSFEKDSTGVRAYGMGDCNRFFGMPVIGEQDKTISFGNMGVTRMMCPNQVMEDAYVKALTDAKKYSVSGGALILKDGETVLAKFSENKKEETKL